MEGIITLILGFLATYGIATAISSFDGLFGAFVRLRNRFEGTEFGRVISCPACLSVFIAIPFTIFLKLNLLDYLAIVGSAFIWKEYLG